MRTNMEEPSGTRSKTNANFHDVPATLAETRAHGNAHFAPARKTSSCNLLLHMQQKLVKCLMLLLLRFGSSSVFKLILQLVLQDRDRIDRRSLATQHKAPKRDRDCSARPDGVHFGGRKIAFMPHPYAN